MLEKASALRPRLVAWRREFHHHPELGFRETQTAARVAAVLQELGFRVRTGVGRTGVVGELGQGEPVVGIRADMDALPIQEANDCDYASEVPGMMHACGHDAHTAMALGAAMLLAQEEFPGTVRFLHQPSEEVADSEGLSGAPRMVQDGAMQGVQMVIALHVDPRTPVGQIRIAAGPFSGGVDSFFAKIIGRGGHGAWPHELIDPIYITGLVTLALHGIVSRRLNPFAPAVISIGSLHAGQAENVIPEQVELSGTIRFTQPEIQKQIHAELEQALKISQALGGDYALKIEIGTPQMINDAEVVDLIQYVAGEILGAENVLPPLDNLGAEDFGVFMELAPGAMFALGCQIKDRPRLLHNPYFDIDERCLPLGAAILAETALRYLRQAA
jgi:amidohydrolase